MDSMHEEMMNPEKEKKGEERVIDRIAKKSRVCDVCGECFNSQQALGHHKKREHEEKHNYICATCNKSFSQERYLKEHERLHKEKQECLFCPKTFGHKKTLNRHMRKEHDWQG